MHLVSQGDWGLSQWLIGVSKCWGSQSACYLFSMMLFPQKWTMKHVKYSPCTSQSLKVNPLSPPPLFLSISLSLSILSLSLSKWSQGHLVSLFLHLTAAQQSHSLGSNTWSYVELLFCNSNSGNWQKAQCGVCVQELDGDIPHFISSPDSTHQPPGKNTTFFHCQWKIIGKLRRIP